MNIYKHLSYKSKKYIEIDEFKRKYENKIRYLSMDVIFSIVDYHMIRFEEEKEIDIENGKAFFEDMIVELSDIIE